MDILPLPRERDVGESPWLIVSWGISHSGSGRCVIIFIGYKIVVQLRKVNCLQYTKQKLNKDIKHEKSSGY